MAVVTAATTGSAQGIFTVITIAAVSDADTFVGPATPKGFWAMGTSNPTTQASAGVAVTESAGTYTFYPGEDAISVTLFIVE